MRTIEPDWTKRSHDEKYAKNRNFIVFIAEIPIQMVLKFNFIYEIFSIPDVI